MTTHRPAIAVQIDLDPVYAYLASHRGRIPEPSHPDPVYTIGVPRLRAFLERMSLTGTLFAVGQDVEHPAHAGELRAALADGHEIANHSHRHRLGFGALPIESVREEIQLAHAAITRTLDVAPVGFRAPGWSVSSRVIGVLTELGYEYDSSITPSWTALAQNVVLKILSGFRARAGFGDPRTLLAPSEPYFPDSQAPWKRGSQRSLAEVPAGVMPIVRVPYSATMQMMIGTAGFATSVRLLGRRPLVYVFHGVDFLAPDEMDPGMARHPTGRRPLERKLATLERLMRMGARGRRPTRTRDIAAEIASGIEASR